MFILVGMCFETDPKYASRKIEETVQLCFLAKEANNDRNPLSKA